MKPFFLLIALFLAAASAAAQVLSVGDAVVNEGNGGMRSATFTVALQPPAAAPVTVAYATADGTARAGSSSPAPYSNRTPITLAPDGAVSAYPSSTITPAGHLPPWTIH